MANSGFDIRLLSFLKAQYPVVPSATVVKVMNKYGNDQDKCRRALDLEAGRGFGASDIESSPSNINNSSNVDSSGEGKSVSTRIKELQVSRDGGPQLKLGTPERHVSKLERSVGNASRPSEQAKRPFVSQSVSFTVQTPDGLSSVEAQTKSNWVSTSNLATPQTAPPDFSSFFSRSATDIPNINCRTHGTSGFSSELSGSALHGSRPKQFPVNFSSASNSPLEQRRPVKVINIPAGSSSGGTVSSAVAQPNQRHIHMNFGDSGGSCTISTPTLQRYGSTPNISQHYRSEIRTEAPTPQPVHSSNMVVSTSDHTNSLAPVRNLNDSSGRGRRTPNPPLSLNTNNSFSPSLAPNSTYSAGKLSTPIQASSPGIAHSKPVFVDVKNDRMASAQMHDGYNGASYPSVYYPGNSVRPAPLNPSLLPKQNVMFGAHIGPVHNSHFNSSVADFPVNQRQNEYLYSQNSQPQGLPGFHSPPVNMGQPPNSGYSSNSYSQFHQPANVVGYSLLSGHFPGPTPGRMANYTHYGLNSGFPLDTHLSKSPSAVEQQFMNSRTNSQESDHSINPGADYEAGFPFHSALGSRVSSLSSLSSDSSGRLDGVASGTRSRSGSMQDEAEYVQALLQHQKRQMQKLQEEISQHRVFLNKLRSEVSVMERSMIESSHANRSLPSVEDISWLCEKNRQLQTDIQLYMNEADMYKSGQTPLNNISPLDQQNFFENMPTGQQDPIYSVSPGRPVSPTGPPPPPRPPPPIPLRQRPGETGQAGGGAVSGVDIFRAPVVQSAQQLITSGDPEEGELPWSCSACTFSNHPALRKCEMCEMPRVMPPHATLSLGLPTLNPHQALSSLPPRLAPGSGVLSNMHPRSGSPHSVLGHQYHRAGT